MSAPRLLHRGRLDDAVVLSILGAAVKAAGFMIMNMLIPEQLRNYCFEPKVHPAGRHAQESAVGHARVCAG